MPTIYSRDPADDLKGGAMSGIRIISICDNESLRQSRELVLKSDGYDVQSFFSWNAPGVSVVRDAQIVVMCRSVDEERARALTYLFRGLNGNLKILDLRSLVASDNDEHNLGGGAFLNLIENACGTDAMSRNDANADLTEA